MKDNHLEENLHQYLTGGMPGEFTLIAEEHLKQCEKCRKEAEVMKETLTLLDRLEPPPLSAEFKRKVIQGIYDAPLPPQPLLQRIRGWFRIPAIRWSFQGAAVAAAVLLTFTIFRSFILQTPGTPETQIRSGPEFKIEEVKTPVTIETRDIESALTDLGKMIQSCDGRLVRRRKIDTGMEVTMNIPKEREAKFLHDLSQLGKVEIKGNEFKDTEGNVVVLLKSR